MNIGIIEKIKNNRNIIGLMGTCLINNLLYMFLNTFMVAYFITLTNYNYKLISIYYILSFVGILLTFLILAGVVKNKNQVLVFRSGIVTYCIYILLIALLREKIVTYYALLGFFYGIVQGLFWVACHVLINEYTENVENDFISLKSILSKILKIFFPIIFGASIELTSFSSVAKIVVLLSIMQFCFSLLIKDESKIHSKKYNLREYINYIRNKSIFKDCYKLALGDGIVAYLLETVITILIVMTYKTTISLGIITTIFSICSILSVYFLQYKIKNNNFILKLCCVFMSVSLLFLLININKISIVIYNLCNAVFLVILRNNAETKSYEIIKKDDKVKKDYIVEHQVVWQICLNIARIIGYIALFVVSLFDSILILKVLLIIITLVIISYSTLMIKLNNKKY